MNRLCAYLLAAANCVVLAQAAERTPVLHIEREFFAERLGPGIPQFGGGLIASDDFHTSMVWTTDMAGRTLTEATLALPGVKRFQIAQAAAGPDGGIAVAASAVGAGEQWSSVIVWVGKAGHLVRVVKTSPYAVFSLAFAPDGSLWTAGRVRDEASRTAPEHDVIRRYDSQGRVIQSLLPKTQFGAPPRLDPCKNCWFVPGEGQMSVLFPRTNDWIELSLDGRVLKRIKIAPPAADFERLTAATLGGQVYISGQITGRKGPRVFRLDQATGELAPVEFAAPMTSERISSLLGAAGDRLLALGDRRFMLFRAE